MSHTHPRTGEAFGDTQTFDRGRTLAADGGRPTTSSGDARNASREETTAADDGDPGPGGDDAETMADVDHTPRKDSDGVNHVYDDGAPQDREDE